MTVADHYPAHVFWSDEDEGFIAVAPDLPGCSAFGETRESALAELLLAIDAWIAAAQAAGNDVPKPSKPAEKQKYSGKVLLRMPKDLHARLAKAAEDEGTSLNQHMVYLLASTFAEGSRYSIVNKQTSLDPPMKIYKIGATNKYTAWFSLREHLCQPIAHNMFKCVEGFEVSTNDVDQQWPEAYPTFAGVSQNG